jgi:parallel beta-helix repeat protein
MTKQLVVGLTLLLLGPVALPACVRVSLPLAAASGTDTVHVAPPSGEREADRASILAALEQVEPGGTVQFAAGRYLVGEIIRVDVPRVTLLGHPDGTTLRGCDPDAFSEFPAAVFACNGFELTGGHQTVRNLTFEYAWHGLHVGCCNIADMEEFAALQGGKRREPSLTGGYRIEDNTFRNSPNGIRVAGEADEPTVIRGNHFVNTYHAVVVNGRTAHVLDNDVSVAEPERVPFSGHPGGAIAVTSFQMSDDLTACADNVIAGNRVEGHPDAIVIFTQPGTACRRNVVRDNTIVVRRVRFSTAWGAIQIANESDSTIVGVPLGLYNLTEAVFGPRIEGAPAGVLEDNVIEGNRVIGAEGVGIELFRASRNRIVNNSIRGVVVRDPFPGNRLSFGPDWQEANGSGIWVSPGSAENEILGNTFEDITSDAIVIEGDRNRVETRSAIDAVRDLGSGNRVSGPAAAADRTAGRVPAGGTVETRTASRGGPIIDMHLHAAAIRSAAHTDSVLEWMDRHGVARAMLLVHDTAGLGWRERAPDRFVVAVSFPCHEGRQPETQQPCLAEWEGWPNPEWLRRQHAAGRLGALGELFNVYYGIPATDERLAPYWALAEELDIPVGVHTGRGPPPARRAPGCCSNFNDDHGDPALLEQVLRRHPRLRVWLMHTGGPFLDEAIALMRAFPNVYADMSILNSMAPPAVEAQSLRAFLDAGLGDRIMLGTDNQPIERILERMDALDFLSEAQRRAIFYDNAARFLRLSPAEMARDHDQAARTRVAR